MESQTERRDKLPTRPAHAPQQQRQRGPADERQHTAHDERRHVQVVQQYVRFDRVKMLRPRIKFRDRNEQRNSKKDQQRQCRGCRHDRRRNDLAPAPGRQPVDHREGQTADENLCPECEADQPSSRGRFWIEIDGNDQQHRSQRCANKGCIP